MVRRGYIRALPSRAIIGEGDRRYHFNAVKLLQMYAIIQPRRLLSDHGMWRANRKNGDTHPAGSILRNASDRQHGVISLGCRWFQRALALFERVGLSVNGNYNIFDNIFDRLTAACGQQAFMNELTRLSTEVSTSGT
ncbi:MAG TPA: hypothetical protein VN650_11415, partial [Gemmatimonadaceae bacterium]|nr:hypothetical protein [Gemmatimonadaceae bacterium]